LSYKMKKKKRYIHKIPKTFGQERRERVAKEVVGNIGQGKAPNVKRAMKNAGYPDSYAKNPQYLTRTDEWKDLMAKYLPPELLAEKHNQLLKHGTFKNEVFPIEKSDEEISAFFTANGKKLWHIKVESHITGKGKTRQVFKEKRAYYHELSPGAVERGLDMGYKLQSKYGDVGIKHKFSELGDDDIEAEIARAVSTALGLVQGEGEEEGGE
jgi:hypothetical protein